MMLTMILQKCFSNYSNFNFSLGKSERFQDLNHFPQPGPGQYKIGGFTDKILKESQKKEELARLRKQEMQLQQNHAMMEHNEEEGEANNLSRNENDD